HAIAGPDAGLIEALRQAQRARAKLGVGGGVKWAFDRARNDRAFRVVDSGMVDDAMAKERPILHQSAHRVSSQSSFFATQRAGSAASGRADFARPRTRTPQGYRHVAAAQPENRRLRPLAQPKRRSEKRAMSWGVAPVVARSATISPITGANLK